MLDKPPGPTSHDVVAIVRRAFHTRRVGHAGTLDPFASGLLLVLLGQATRLVRYLVGLPKAYQGLIRLGETTTTDDPTGQVTGTNDGWTRIDDSGLKAAMASLVGQRDQRPPPYSAKRVHGERAHRLARRGNAVALPPTRVHIYQFELLERRGPDVRFRAAVGSGTYVRALARELGEALGCGAHLGELRRTDVGPFALDGAVQLDDVRRGRAEPAAPAAALPHLPRADIDDAQRARLIQGQPIEATQPHTGPVALLHGNRLVAVAQASAGQWRPQVVLAE